jgi:hypothetical protein
MAQEVISMIRGWPLVLLLCLAGCGRNGDRVEPPQTDVSDSPAIAQGKPAASRSNSDPKSLHFDVDLTHDGRPEFIKIGFPVSDIHMPFSWTLSIRTTGGELILSDLHDDGNIDEMVSSPEYVDDCAGYEECKRRYYFTVLPKVISDCLIPSVSPWLDDEQLVQRLEKAARMELRATPYSPEQVEAALSEMKTTLSNTGVSTLCVPQRPGLVDPPRIWVESLQMFVAYDDP